MSDDIQTVQTDYAEAMEMLFRQSQTIKRLHQENEKLRALLKPFAHEAQFISSHAEDTWFYYDGIRFGDLRAAAAALKETGE